MRALLALAALVASVTASADAPQPHPGTVEIATRYGYAELVDRLLAAVEDHGLNVVARASATQGAKSIGVTIPGNQVVMVFAPRYAVRMLAASVPAGIEAPIRFYITENPDGTADLTYRTPSSLFAPYEHPDLDTMAEELDSIFFKIAEQAAR